MAGVSSRAHTPIAASVRSSQRGNDEAAVRQQPVEADIDAERAEHVVAERDEQDAGPAEEIRREREQRHQVDPAIPRAKTQSMRIGVAEAGCAKGAVRAASGLALVRAQPTASDKTSVSLITIASLVPCRSR